MWLKGAMAVLLSEACKKALAACGINPENFGSYDDRLKAQGGERKNYREKRDKEAGQSGGRPHEGSCPKSGDGKTCRCHESEAGAADLGPEKYALANSQSGHIAQNAFFQGTRGDPCSNMPPQGAGGGAYGYDDNRAMCMDHLGRANQPGTIHYEITQREAQYAEYLKSQGVQTVTQDQMADGVKGTAAIAAGGAQSRHAGDAENAKFDSNLGKMTAERQETAKATDAAKDAQTKELQKRSAQSGAAGQSGSAAGGTPNSPSGNGPTSKDKKDAIECIENAWKQSLNDMRARAVDEHSTVANSKACKDALRAYNKGKPKNEKIKSYSQLPDDERKKVDEKAKDEVAARQKELEAKGAGSAGKAGDPSPTKDECREYQANWLNERKKADGKFPDMQGRVPDSKEAAATNGNAGQEESG
jgi:hypothetical protein